MVGLHQATRKELGCRYQMLYTVHAILPLPSWVGKKKQRTHRTITVLAISVLSFFFLFISLLPHSSCSLK